MRCVVWMSVCVHDEGELRVYFYKWLPEVKSSPVSMVTPSTLLISDIAPREMKKKKISSVINKCPSFLAHIRGRGVVELGTWDLNRFFGLFLVTETSQVRADIVWWVKMEG